LDSMSLMKLINAALQERPVVHVMVSAAENLNKLIPNAQRRDFGSTMARLNNPELFSRLFGTEVKTVEEAFALSSRPLNLNEFA
ncbi:MAG: GNAT family N-acetyltransferase, partial [Solobacterium sp.]|nr:GNAT family N-acetyltransferase [Solobacterium sp.]